MKKLAIFALIAGVLVGCASSGGGSASNTSYASPPLQCHDYTNTGFGGCGVGFRWH